MLDASAEDSAESWGVERMSLQFHIELAIEAATGGSDLVGVEVMR